MEEFQRIREVGYAVDREESHYGGNCFACPLFDQRQYAIAAVSICAPLIRLTPEREKEMVHVLLETARQASTAIQEMTAEKGWNAKE
jgi:DNA-binding IclR family transcriptional regulator